MKKILKFFRNIFYVLVAIMAGIMIFRFIFRKEPTKIGTENKRKSKIKMFEYTLGIAILAQSPLLWENIPHPHNWTFLGMGLLMLLISFTSVKK